MKKSVEQRIIERLEELADVVASGKPVRERFDCRRRVLKEKPNVYDPKMVKKARQALGASQAVFAIFLGISPKTVQAWERGDLAPNKMACRFMDEMRRNPQLYRERLEEMFTTK